MSGIQFSPGVPTLDLFRDGSQWGPLTINQATSAAYYADPVTGAIVALAVASFVGILPVANGGTGTATPGLVAGTNVTITGVWPNQTINSSSGSATSGPLVDYSFLADHAGEEDIHGIALSVTAGLAGSFTTNAILLGNGGTGARASSNWTINANGGMVAAAPTGSTTPAIAITMPANTGFGISITGPIAGNSNGITISNIGNSNADRHIQSTNQNGINQLTVWGDGHFVLGSAGASGGNTITGSAAGDVAFPVGNALITGSGKALGYGTGSGGTVTQITSATTAVTLNKGAGQIVCFAASSPAALTPLSFTLINSVIAATDTILCNVLGSTAGNGKCIAQAEAAAGSAVITVTNTLLAAAGGDSLKINFAVIKAVTA